MGVDHVPQTWLKQWTLLDLFIVLVIAAAIGKLWHWGWGALTLVMLGLIYHEVYAPQGVWLSLIAAIALLRVLPVLGWFSRFVRLYRDLSLIALLIIVLPFMMQQVRQSIYPQLERPRIQLAKSTPYTTANQYSERDSVQRKIQQQEQISKSSSYYYDAMPAAPKLSQRKKLVQIDPNAQVQTGPGLPRWQWHTIAMRWSGPVKQNQSVQLWLLSPAVNSVLGGLRVVLLAIMTAFLLWVSWGPGARLLFRPKSTSQRLKKSKIAMPSLLLFSLLLLPLVSYAEIPTNSTSNPFPPSSLLEELQHRLLASPDCLPDCAGSPRLKLELGTDQLQGRMEIHSLTATAVPLPGLATQWLPQAVWLDGEPAKALLRRQNGQLWLSITEGIHQVQFIGPLPKRNRVQLPLPLKSHFVEINAKGWRVEGLHENGVADDSLQLTREQANNLRKVELEMGSLPPFIQVERTLLFSLDWQVETRIIRKTPLGSAIVLDIPLLKGESVTSENIRVENGKALIHLSPNQSELHWISVFDKQETLTLIAPENTFSHEVWRLDVSAIWHVEIDGIPVIHHQDKGRWLPEWRPWPGERVTLHLSRPESITGQVLTLDRSQLIVNPGHRTTDNRLLLNLRSSRGMQHKLTLPENAQLQSVKINNTPQPIRQEGRFVTLPIIPGTQQIELQFQQPKSMTQTFYTPTVDLGINSVNTHIDIKMPKDRWILFVDGEPMGPAVMIWGILIVIVLVSIGLGQISLTPLKTHHWLLLGIVLSQVQVSLMLAVIAWFMALGWRARIASDMPALKFDAIQIGLGFLTLVALSTLLFAIERGLLGHPNMHIAGNGSTAHYLRWYEDRTTGLLPQVWVYSWSMWIYRIAMLLWALWLSFALLRWLRWGWQSFSTHGLWKTLRTKKGIQT